MKNCKIQAQTNPDSIFQQPQIIWGYGVFKTPLCNSCGNWLVVNNCKNTHACYRELGIGEVPQEVVTVVEQLTGRKDVKEAQYGIMR